MAKNIFLIFENVLISKTIKKLITPTTTQTLAVALLNLN